MRLEKVVEEGGGLIVHLIRETITPIVDTKKLCVSKYSIRKSQGISRNTVLLINYIFYVL